MWGVAGAVSPVSPLPAGTHARILRVSLPVDVQARQAAVIEARAPDDALRVVPLEAGKAVQERREGHFGLGTGEVRAKTEAEPSGDTWRSCRLCS